MKQPEQIIAEIREYLDSKSIPQSRFACQVGMFMDPPRECTTSWKHHIHRILRSGEVGVQIVPNQKTMNAFQKWMEN